MLLCGKTGFITPAHFDEQENLFVQLNGKKRVRLFHPDNWVCLYPFPIGHPCDRQSQLTLPVTPGVLLLFFIFMVLKKIYFIYRLFKDFTSYLMT